MPAVKRKAIPKAVRQQVYDSLNGHCGYCGCEITYKEMQVDHIEAVYLHEAELNAGEAQQVNSIENYMPACRMCNFYKSKFQKAAGNAARKTGKAVYIQIGEEIWDCAGNQKASAVLF